MTSGDKTIFMMIGYYDSLAQTGRKFSWVDDNAGKIWIAIILIVVIAIIYDVLKRDYKKK